jgi:RHS repeat-associated protein
MSHGTRRRAPGQSDLPDRSVPRSLARVSDPRAGGLPVETIKDTATTGVAGSTVTWLFTDLDHTVDVQTIATTGATTDTYRDPYGNPIAGSNTTWADGNGYLNKPASPTTGLTSLGDRFYNPTLGTFTTPDPLLATNNPQQINGYTYAANNPITLTDPTGDCYEDTTDALTHSSNCAGGHNTTAPSATTLTDWSTYGQGTTTWTRPHNAATTPHHNTTPTPAASGWPTTIPSSKGSIGLAGQRDDTSLTPATLGLAAGITVVVIAGVVVLCVAIDGACIEPIGSALTITSTTGATTTAIGTEAGSGIATSLDLTTDATATETAADAPVAFGPAPKNAWETFERVESKGSPLPGYKGGSTFANDGSGGAQILPRGSGVTYREWDVNPNVKGVDRGAERIVTGSDGTAYYTNNHYTSFTQFTGPGG